MKNKILFLLSLILLTLPVMAQEYIPRLELDKREKKSFASRDSVIHLKIDTLILKDRSSLRFYNKKQVILEVGYAEIGKKVSLLGQDGENNGSQIDLQIHVASLGDLYIDAGGLKATRGRNALPHGNGGAVTIIYDKEGIQPQMEERKSPHYIRVNVDGGANLSDSHSEIAILQSQMRSGQMALGGLPQGRIYSGTPGTNGSVILKGK
jgi:hypothetical protein